MGCGVTVCLFPPPPPPRRALCFRQNLLRANFFKGEIVRHFSHRSCPKTTTVAAVVVVVTAAAVVVTIDDYCNNNNNNNSIISKQRTGNAQSQGTTQIGHMGHCAHTAESANVIVQNI